MTNQSPNLGNAIDNLSNRIPLGSFGADLFGDAKSAFDTPYRCLDFITGEIDASSTPTTYLSYSILGLAFLQSGAQLSNSTRFVFRTSGPIRRLIHRICNHGSGVECPISPPNPLPPVSNQPPSSQPDPELIDIPIDNPTLEPIELEVITPYFPPGLEPEPEPIPPIDPSILGKPPYFNLPFNFLDPLPPPQAPGTPAPWPSRIFNEVKEACELGNYGEDFAL